MAETKTPNHSDIVSYGFGQQMGHELARHPVNKGPGINLQQVITGLSDAFYGQNPQYTQEQLNEAFQELQKKVEAIVAEQQQAMVEAGKVYLDNNAQKPGVTVTESGLQYEVITEGNGEQPAATATVRTHYHGCFTNGQVFDSSVERNEPAEFPVNGVIAGWTEALQMMKVGSKWRLTVPPELAYGANGAGNAIPPHATLVFEVELLDIL